MHSVICAHKYKCVSKHIYTIHISKEYVLCGWTQSVDKMLLLIYQSEQHSLSFCKYYTLHNFQKEMHLFDVHFMESIPY